MGNSRLCCSVRTAEVGDPLWQVRVERLARELSGPRERAEDFTERRCQACGEAWLCNSRLYGDTEPFACGDGSAAYAPGTRDHYWYALVLRGIDPEGHSERRVSRWHRRYWELRGMLKKVGLNIRSFT